MTRSTHPSLVPPRADVLLAAGFVAASLAQVAIAPVASPAVSVLVAFAIPLPLAWRRVQPAAAALAMTAAWAVPTPGGYLLLGYVMAGLLFYSLALHDPNTWRVVVVTAVSLTTSVVVTLLGPEIWQAAIGAALAIVGPAVAGRLVAHDRAQNARLRELTAELVRERDAAERVAAAEERTRIARELHDVIGHEITVIALQADAAAAALARAPERAAVPVDRIRTTAARTLTEMRRVVGLLRDPAEDEDLRPQPGLADLPALVEDARAAGAEVDLRLDLPPAPPPPSLQLTVFRIVQEALTNARRHAPGAPVRVRVGAGADALSVEVANRRGRPGGGPGGGHGLVGMRERARMHGGSLEAGPAADGFVVRARLPLVLEAAR
ncbi:sensor histidine kinase [Geodermatophilus sp. SYSU D00815]